MRETQSQFAPYRLSTLKHVSAFFYILYFSSITSTKITSFADFGSRFDLYEAKWDVIKDIYKRPLKLHHFDNLIDQSKYFLDLYVIIL